ncbi:ATP-binding protein [bacterium]|nr:ATP-binding protein [bacterium]
MHERSFYLTDIHKLFEVHPAVAILGPRQCGKTTLAKMYSEQEDEVTHLDLEDPTDLARLNNPKLALENLTGLVVIDEIQRAPELFPILRVLIDRQEGHTRYLILGSASRELIRQSSESLAGRMGTLELTPFTSREVAEENLNRLWLRGGFPRSFLAASNRASQVWRQSYITTFLERDLPALGVSIPAETMRRFWMMLTHYHGQTLNYSELGRSFGIADTTVRKYLDLLIGTFMIRTLAPWHENISKRQVKSPKLYVRDSGLFHRFLGTDEMKELLAHPKLGASWEGFALEEIIRIRRASHAEAFFWATHADAELDLLIVKDGKREGYEIKYTDSPKLRRSMDIAVQDLKLDSLTVIFPGKGRFPLNDHITAVGLSDFIALCSRPTLS